MFSRIFSVAITETLYFEFSFGSYTVIRIEIFFRVCKTTPSVKVTECLFLHKKTGTRRKQLLAGKQLGYAGLYQCLHNTLKAHARIYHIYKEEFEEQNGQIGTAIPCFGLFPKTSNDIQAVDTFFQFNCAIMAAPIFSKTGDYPEIVKKHVAENSKLDGLPKSILPEFTSEWVQYIK